MEPASFLLQFQEICPSVDAPASRGTQTHTRVGREEVDQDVSNYLSTIVKTSTFIKREDADQRHSGKPYTLFGLIW